MYAGLVPTVRIYRGVSLADTANGEATYSKFSLCAVQREFMTDVTKVN